MQDVTASVGSLNSTRNSWLRRRNDRTAILKSEAALFRGILSQSRSLPQNTSKKGPWDAFANLERRPAFNDYFSYITGLSNASQPDIVVIQVELSVDIRNDTQ